MIAILDYGIGNIESVRKALQKVGSSSEITRDPSLISRADALVFPGVGAFGEAMDFLGRSGLLGTVESFLGSNRPVLGICLGMQVLFEKSEESPWATGLSVIPGLVKKLDFATKPVCVRARLPKVPHMGWNRVKIKRRNTLLESIPDESYFYFAHSYYTVPTDQRVEVGKTFYGYDAPSGAIADANMEGATGGIVMASVVATGFVFGVQFHPEKSGDVGLALLRNFTRLVG